MERRTGEQKTETTAGQEWPDKCKLFGQNKHCVVVLVVFFIT